MSDWAADETLLFFYRLAERRNRENDLSDITWALFRASRPFATAFAQFLGITNLSVSSLDISRETPLGDDSRVDLVVTHGDHTTYVEVKIYDTNYHLAQYAGRIAQQADSSLVLLVNHDLRNEDRREAEQLGWRIRKWRTLVEHIELARPDSTLIQSYLRYVRRVCNMIELLPIRFDADSMYSLKVLHALLSEVVPGIGHGAFEYSLYSRQERAHGADQTSVCFQLNCKQSEGIVHLWGLYGLMYGEPGRARLGLWFDRDWNPDFVAAPHQWLTADLKESRRAGVNSDGLWFYAEDGDLQQLLRLPLSEQKNMLMEMFRELMVPIEREVAVLPVQRKDANTSQQETPAPYTAAESDST